jgi:hypothetical protein
MDIEKAQKEMRTDIAQEEDTQERKKRIEMFIDMILVNQMRLRFVHLIALVDGQNMVVESEIMVVQVVEAKHLTFLSIYYL